MPLFWFLAGALSALAALIVLLPWLRSMPRLGALPAPPWQAGVGAAAVLVAVLGLCFWLGHKERANPLAASADPATSGTAAMSATPPMSASEVLSAGAALSGTPVSGADSMPAASAEPTASSRAGSMDSAIAALQARLAKGGGTQADWELLAKSYEFLGRPAEAAQARARRLPALPRDDEPSPAPAGSTVSGEVSLAETLRAKAAPGATLFIVAKSVDSPGAPVAVFRGTVSSWPIKFTLDDSQSMLPGRNLSSSGRVTIEARVSKSGQAMPASGDLQGTSGVITPADHRPLKILIDHAVP